MDSNILDLDLKNFKLNKEGSFSITRPYESKQVVDIISKFINFDLSELILTDATACVGGDLINFSNYFWMVNGIEINSNNFNLLVYNCKKFRCKNVNLFCQDYCEIYKNLKQDIIYIDPPWGGTGYRKYNSVSLEIGNLKLWELMRNIIDLRLCKYIFVKVPINVSLEFIHYDRIYNIYNKNGVDSFKLICSRVQ
jgi:hypothetical protein